MDQTLVNKTSTTHGQLLSQDSGQIVLGLPETEYQLHLMVDPPIQTSTNPHIAGTIHARARRVDIVQTGGRFIEPVYGRPRRIQGTITAIDPIGNTLTVDSGCPIVCLLVTGQKTSQFSLGQLVSFDVERGATFEPLAAPTQEP